MAMMAITTNNSIRVNPAIACPGPTFFFLGFIKRCLHGKRGGHDCPPLTPIYY
jgi:hypothetical protein